MQANLLYRRNPLAYPAGVAPGINPSHPVSQGLRFSGVASAGGFVSLTQGSRGVITGAPSFGIDGLIGPGFAPLVTTDKATFAGQPTTNDLSATLAAVVSLSAISGEQCLVNSSGANSGWRLYQSNAGGGVRLTAGGVLDINAGLGALVVSTPYLVMASANASTSNFLILNLKTGKILTASSTGATSVAPNGTYTIGNDTFNSVVNGKIAAAMFSARYTTPTEMRQWAADPWAFWYPRQMEMLVAVATVPPPTTVLYQLMNVG